MRNVVIGWAAPLALLCAPVGVAAQDEAAPDFDLFAGMAQAFAAEPLSAEQAARLPAAEALVARIIPPGSLQEVMGSMMGAIFTPMVEAVEPDPAAVVAEQLGLSAYDLDITPERAERAAAMLDPAWRERAQREASAIPTMTTRMMGALEPAMRTAMAELYAIHFSAAELADIDAFFATPSGASYARKSLTMSSDPRMVATLMQQMPVMFEAAASMEAEMAALTADLPPARSLADLSPTELKGLAQLVGMSVEELQYQAEWGGAFADDAALEAAVETANAAVEAAVAAVEAAVSKEGW